MPITFIHLSDIHFGQEKGAQIIINNDVKERLIEDARTQVRNLPNARADGIIVSGDIAYAGKSIEYQQAGEWLDRLAIAVGCDKTAVQVVPGNHDIDRDGISSGCKLMLEAIARDGEAQLDAFLEFEVDREALYNRFAAYRPFAEGYNCPLDKKGGIASDRRYEIAPGRVVRVIGLNSALICAKNDTEGRLLLGARQHVLPRSPGEELIVVCHHPLNWLQDSDAARRYVRSRARVFISGHEHNPSLRIENIRDGTDLMLLAAGATAPLRAEDGFTYTYNILQLDWDAVTDGLKVTIVPRAWSDEETDFVADEHRLGGKQPTNVLGCPNFRAQQKEAQEQVAPVAPQVVEKPETIPAVVARQESEIMAANFPLLLLKFFRDLTPTQRLLVLAKLKALPEDWHDPLTHIIERHVIDGLARDGRLDDLEAAMVEIQNENETNAGEKK